MKNEKETEPPREKIDCNPWGHVKHLFPPKEKEKQNHESNNYVNQLATPHDLTPFAIVKLPQEISKSATKIYKRKKSLPSTFT